MRLRLIIVLALSLFCAPAQAYRPHADIIPGPVPGEVTEVLDGDTVAVRVHVWLGEDIDTHVRVAGIDAPEIHGKCEAERQRAQDAKRELAKLVSGGKVKLYGVRLEKYAGRVMARIEAPSGADVGQHMLDEGLARPYQGKKRGGWCGG
jgi:endonuclease YncB( thermonuclease family)